MLKELKSIIYLFDIKDNEDIKIKLSENAMMEFQQDLKEEWKTFYLNFDNLTEEDFKKFHIWGLPNITIYVEHDPSEKLFSIEIVEKDLVK